MKGEGDSGLGIEDSFLRVESQISDAKPHKPPVTLIGPFAPFRGGIARHTEGVAATLERNGHVVKRITFRKQYPRWLYPGRTDRDSGLALTEELRVERMLAPFAPWTWIQVANRVRGSILIPWWTTFWAVPYAVLAARVRRRGARVIYLVHNVLPHEPGPFDWLLARQALSQGDGFVVHAAGEEQRLCDLLPGNKKPVARCPHPIPFLATGNHPKNVTNLIDSSSGSASEPELLFFGFVRPYKGLDVLIEALGLLRKSGGPVSRLIVAGEFWQSIQEYQRQVEGLGLTRQVHFENRYISEQTVGEFFTPNRIFVAPYRSATQSGAVKLAMAYGLPLIVTEPAADDLVRGWPLAQIISPGNAPALADAIQRWSAHPPIALPLPDPWPSWLALAGAVEGLLA